jgi:hypothetical protein
VDRPECSPEDLEEVRGHMVFGYQKAAECLLDGIKDVGPVERRSILTVAEWFEAQADRIENEQV